MSAFAVAIGVKRTRLFALHMSAFDPKRTLAVGGDAGLLRKERQQLVEQARVFRRSRGSHDNRFFLRVACLGTETAIARTAINASIDFRSESMSAPQLPI